MSNKNTLMQRKIHAFTCVTDQEQMALAIIEGVSFYFRAPTPMLATAKADEWRRDVVANDKRLTAAQRKELLGEDA